MELLPAHQPLLEDDTDEDMSDEQVRELLNEAAARMRAKAAGKPTATANVPFKLPRLRPGHLADTYETTDGNITRLDHSKLVDQKQQALANGIKKIDDPLAIKKQKIEVCATILVLRWIGNGTVQVGHHRVHCRAPGYIEGDDALAARWPTTLYTAIHYHYDFLVPLMIIIPIFLLSRSGSRLGYSPANLMLYLVHSYTEALHHTAFC
jgi:hypothetical protein